MPHRTHWLRSGRTTSAARAAPLWQFVAGAALLASACSNGGGSTPIVGTRSPPETLGRLLPCSSGGACVPGDPGPGGGIVFYVSPTAQWWGSYLEVAGKDWHGESSDPLMRIGCDGVDASFAATFADGIGDGIRNTERLAGSCMEAATAANAVVSYRPKDGATVVTGWYLPSLAEATALFEQRTIVGDLPNYGVLTSSPDPAARAGSCYQCFRSVGFSESRQQVYSGSMPRWYAYYVRPIHAFGPTNGSLPPPTD